MPLLESVSLVCVLAMSFAGIVFKGRRGLARLAALTAIDE